MWERCSLATRMGRFHAPVRRIPAAYLRTVLSDPSTSLVAVAGRTASLLTQNALVADLLRRIPGEFSLTRDGTTLVVRVCLARLA